jgi:hypothetical protein
MKESVTYQAVLEEGELKAARKAVLLVGRERLGEPDASSAAAINALADVPRLEELLRRAVHVSSWQELLGTPVPRRRGRRRPTDS